MNTLYLDLETYSSTDIRNGTYAYAENAQVLLFAYAWNDEPAQVLDLTETDVDTREFDEKIAQVAGEIVAHNSMFDRTVLRFNGWTVADSAVKWRDTMVKAYVHSLIGNLDGLCHLLGVSADKAKDKEGKRLIKLFCIPNKDGKRNTREDYPDDWEQFKEYARLDVEAMREVDRKLPSWNAQSEHRHWVLDQKINDRGFAVDLDLVDSALTAIEAEKINLQDRIYEMTDGAVDSATRSKLFLDYLRDTHGVELPNLQKATLEDALKDTSLPQAVCDLIKVRQQAATSSTSKYATLSKSVNSDGRLRGTLQFAGAMRTGRWSGRTFQPQNLPRPTLDDDTIEQGIAALKAGCADMVTDNIMELCSSALRGCIIAPRGKKLCVSDLSNIEGRAQAWIAGETWKVKAFEDFDAGLGHDLYKMAYAKSFGVDPNTVTKEQRQIGKVQELGLGYGGGVGAFVTFAEVYGLDLEDLADKAWATLPNSDRLAAENFLQFLIDKDERPELSDRVFITCDTLKRVWRNAHSNIAEMWYALENAFRDAIISPNSTINVGRLKVRATGKWVRIKLPSGRFLCYPNSRLHQGSIQYKGLIGGSNKWQYLDTYGGKLFENCIAHDTRVATNRGWVAIQDVKLTDLIWDGEEFVSHKGLVCQGEQNVIAACGVRMTPDHKVLMQDGWREAKHTIGLYRAPVRIPISLAYAGSKYYPEATELKAKVYDILDCGSRNRFVVADATGSPLIVHNCNQAIARDILTDNMHLIENAGYEIILSVHDEVLCETPDTDRFTHQGLSRLLATVPPWAQGIPLAADGFETYRYKKD